MKITRDSNFRVHKYSFIGTQHGHPVCVWSHTTTADWTRGDVTAAWSPRSPLWCTTAPWLLWCRLYCRPVTFYFISVHFILLIKRGGGKQTPNVTLSGHSGVDYLLCNETRAVLKNTACIDITRLNIHHQIPNYRQKTRKFKMEHLMTVEFPIKIISL